MQAAAPKAETKVKAKRRPLSRPQRRNPDKQAITDIVFGAMAEGQSLRQACLIADIPCQCVTEWAAEDPQIRERYAQARHSMLDRIADDTMRLADQAPERQANGSIDPGAVAHQRLRVDTRKWLLSKLAPQRFGDKLLTEHTGTVEVARIERVIVDSTSSLIIDGNARRLIESDEDQ